MTRSVIVPAPARRELYRTARSIASKVSTRSGELWLARIERAIQNLAKDAEQWPEAEEAGLFGFNLRCCLEGDDRTCTASYFASTTHVLKLSKSDTPRKTTSSKTIFDLHVRPNCLSSCLRLNNWGAGTLIETHGDFA